MTGYWKNYNDNDGEDWWINKSSKIMKDWKIMKDCYVCGERFPASEMIHDKLNDVYDCKKCYARLHTKDKGKMKTKIYGQKTEFIVDSCTRKLNDLNGNQYDSPAFKILEVGWQSRKIIYEMPMKYDRREDAEKLCEELNEKAASPKTSKQMYDDFEPNGYKVEGYGVTVKGKLTERWRVVEIDSKTKKHKNLESYKTEKEAMEVVSDLTNKMAEASWDAGTKMGLQQLRKI